MAHRVCGMTRMRRTLSRCTPSTSASSACGVTRPPGLRKILASPRPSPSILSGSIRESMQVMTAIPACAMPSKPSWSKRGGVLLVRGQEVVEVTHGQDGSGAACQPTRADCLVGVDRPGGGAAEHDQRDDPGRERAEHRAQEDGLLLGDAGELLQVAVGLAHLRLATDLGHRLERVLLGVVAAQADRGQRRDADQHADHPGDHDHGGREPVHVRRRCARARRR